MKPSVQLRRRLVRGFLPFAVVATIAVIVVSSAVGNLYSGHEAFGFEVLWPTPSTYIPGIVSPTAYLQINYTGPGTGNYTYTITSNSTGVVALLGQANVLVSPLSPFRDYVFVTVPANAVVLLQANVYRGAAVPQNLLFSKTLTV